MTQRYVYTIGHCLRHPQKTVLHSLLKSEMGWKENNSLSSPIFLHQTCSLPTLLWVDPDHMNFSFSKSSWTQWDIILLPGYFHRSGEKKGSATWPLCHSHVHITEEYIGSTKNSTRKQCQSCLQIRRRITKKLKLMKNKNSYQRP